MCVNLAMCVACTVQQINNTNSIIPHLNNIPLTMIIIFTYFLLVLIFFFSMSRSSLFCMKGDFLPVAVGQHYKEY